MAIEITPIVTEKATLLSEKLNRYTFRVSPDADKPQIKKLIEDLYGVHIVRINTMIVPGKKKSRYTRSGIIKGSTSDYKKAIVTVAEGETIDFYSNI